MKACIYGAGAIGGWLGVRLAQAGCELSVVARGATLEAIERDGLRLDMEGRVDTVRPKVAQDPAALGVQDLVIVAVKAPALPQVARAMAPLIGPDTIVLTAMNRVPWWFLDGFGGANAGKQLAATDPDGSIAKSIPSKTVIGGVVHAACSLHGPGFVKHSTGRKLIIGEPSGGISERVRALGALLEKAGVEAVLSEQVQLDVWFKLWGNMTMNPVSAITGATSDRVLADPLVRDFNSAVMREAKEIGARLGIPIDQDPEDRHKVTAKLGAFKTSMLQDVEAGRPVELDALVGAVRELGVLTGVPTPMADVLFGLARLHAQVRGLY